MEVAMRIDAGLLLQLVEGKNPEKISTLATLLRGGEFTQLPDEPRVIIGRFVAGREDLRQCSDFLRALGICLQSLVELATARAQLQETTPSPK